MTIRVAAGDELQRPATPLFVIVGPTASGKTEIALAVAEAVDAEIVSADSQQVYRDADIATAKPTPDERRRIPHHVIDFVEPTAQFTAAAFVANADRAIRDIAERGKRVVVAGGTGLYVRALLRGLVALPPANARLRAELAARPLAELHAELAALDRAAAQRISPNDPIRLIRALEIADATGRAPTKLLDAHRFATARYPHRIVAPRWNRAVLRDRIRARAEAMIARGLWDEVATLRRSLPPDAPLLRAIGFGDDAATLIRRTTAFAKRQETWFRKEPGVEWVPMPAPLQSFIDRARAFFDGAPGERA
ncbi:MAG: tRNA (adenosine(37)-N6)-dimethylallyltransferase MiaA [Deltaproteobacteria bacterium]|nr:tRNA (adenosine(37)-N6)-dimethylallyltransferase MiaA [Deltaproteobacteria bacterium]